MLLLQIVGNGYDKEMFYTDGRVKQAYRNYVYMLLHRPNTYTGIQYKDDPTIFSIELMVGPCCYRLHLCQGPKLHFWYAAEKSPQSAEGMGACLAMTAAHLICHVIGTVSDQVYLSKAFRQQPLMRFQCVQNEPHTTDLYERNRGWAPGQLVRNWIWEMAAFVKSIDGNHMVRTAKQIRFAC